MTPENTNNAILRKRGTFNEISKFRRNKLS